MDFHFAVAKAEKPPKNTDWQKIMALFKSFLPLFVLAAFLPFLIGLVAVPTNIGFFTRADASSELRIWLEPSNAIVSLQSETTFSVWASFDSENRLVPEIELAVSESGPISLVTDRVRYSRPFTGKVKIGEITARADSLGQGRIEIDVDSIKITALDEQIDIKTSPATVFIQ